MDIAAAAAAAKLTCENSTNFSSCFRFHFKRLRKLNHQQQQHHPCPVRAVVRALNVKCQEFSHRRRRRCRCHHRPLSAWQSKVFT